MIQRGSGSNEVGSIEISASWIHISIPWNWATEPCWSTGQGFSGLLSFWAESGDNWYMEPGRKQGTIPDMGEE